MEFIDYKSPSEFKSGKKSRAIRSYVTKRQHRLKREAENQAKNSRTDDIQSRATGQPSPSSLGRGLQVNKQGSNQHNPSLSIRTRSTRNNVRSLMRPTSPRLPQQVPQQQMLPCRSALDVLESYIHGTMVPAHVSAFGLGPSECQVASEWFSTSSITEPALYTSALLTAAPNFKQASPELLFYLQSATITSLVTALRTPSRRQNPALILAVECLTFYECLYGDKVIAQRVHRPAMRRLIQAHGGRDGVAVPLSWKKVSVMADIVMEIQMGSEGNRSFLEEERHENGGILEAEWTQALRLYLPDVKEDFGRGVLPGKAQEDPS